MGKKSKVQDFLKDGEGKQVWCIFCFCLRSERYFALYYQLVLHFNLQNCHQHMPSATRKQLLCCHISGHILQERLDGMWANKEYRIMTQNVAQSLYKTK